MFGQGEAGGRKSETTVAANIALFLSSPGWIFYELRNEDTHNPDHEERKQRSRHTMKNNNVYILSVIASHFIVCWTTRYLARHASVRYNGSNLLLPLPFATWIAWSAPDPSTRPMPALRLLSDVSTREWRDVVLTWTIFERH